MGNPGNTSWPLLITNMMKTRFLFLILICFSSTVFANYQYRLDLVNVKDDKVKVELTTPKVTQNTIEFHMPKVVPGTYSISDFGQFISDFKALDSNGKELEVTSPDGINRWEIKNATQLSKITYWVEDTWDSEKGSVFEPGGSNIEAGKNFIINTFAFFGYLDGMKEMNFEVVVSKPKGFYGSTALIPTSSDEKEDKFMVKGYNLLADSPMMYCEPDTAVRMVGGAEVLVSVYSPNGITNAAPVMEGIAPILEAQRKYLGGTLPVKKYAFIAYLAPVDGGGGGMGALEHSYSSLYYMPEVSNDRAGEMMKDVAAHEFFHIVTPLNVHSEEIHYFDYIDPKMSKHLWLYEGVTEYSAGHVQVSYKLITIDQYFQTLSQKMTMASFMLDDVPFTEISAGCLDKYKAQYLNVYQKGALIGACLDIILNDLSNGEFGLQELMRKLEKSYGIETPFKDENLFDKITELSYPAVREFFTKYVEGPNPLPYEEIFAKAGIIYEKYPKSKVLSFGKVGIEGDEEKGCYVVTITDRMNKFGEDMGYKEGDEIISFDGQKVTLENFPQIIADFRANHKEGDKITALVRRPDGKGGFKEKKLKGKAIAVKRRGQHILSLDPKASEKQIKVRNGWLNI